MLTIFHTMIEHNTEHYPHYHTSITQLFYNTSKHYWQNTEQNTYTVDIS